jgi:hypothetical protein
MNNCDILLFQSNYKGKFGWWARIVSLFTRSNWTHIALVLKDPTFINPEYKGYYVLECGGEDWENYWGIMVSPLKTIIESGNHKRIVLRKLYYTVPIEELKTVYLTVKHKKYNTNIIELLGNETQCSVLADPQESNKFICSSFVAYVYTALGLLPDDTKWFYYQPWQFSITNKNLKLIKGHLGEEIDITSNYDI